MAVVEKSKLSFACVAADIYSGLPGGFVNGGGMTDRLAATGFIGNLY